MQAVIRPRWAVALVALGLTAGVVGAAGYTLTQRAQAETVPALAQRASLLSRFHTFVGGGVTVTLRPAQLRPVVTVANGTLVVDPDGLSQLVEQPDRAPRDAALQIDGERVVVRPSTTGRTFDAGATAAALAANPGASTHRLRFRLVAPKVSTEDLRSLRIRELVSEFSTPYPAGEPRVTNIQRAAQLLDGTVLPAGETFSMNDALGERTTERGFVPAPMILGGQLVDSVGGGISQVATTLYNAAFFAGLDLVAHTPHSFYIDRYPMGREATVSWGGPELIFRNDWPAAILIKVDATETSITARFFSSMLGRRIETETGEPFAYTAPTTRYIPDTRLAAGTQVVDQEAGSSGFSVEYTRRVYRGGELVRAERFLTRYDPHDAIVRVGTDDLRHGP
jgi:vancomycin resistance protein YoaR